MNENWSWLGRYIAVIVIAVILAVALGSMDLFQTTTVLSKKLSAAHIVRFLGFAAALAVIWLLGQRAALVLRTQNGPWGFLQYLLLPAVTLIVVSSAHSVILLVLRPMLDAYGRNIYNWLFIASIIAAAAWLIMAVFNQSSSMTAAFASMARSRTDGSKRLKCPQCGAANEEGASYCGQCGAKLAG